jgi:NAD(P)-dependent dehydrogenase (short-subunit alcohol dehydrogenase family)
MSSERWRIDRRQFIGRAALAAGAATLGKGVAAAQPAAAPVAAAAVAPPPLAEVADKVAFISGASSGIGLGQARVLHAAGMRVAVGYIRDDQRDDAQQYFVNGRDRVHFIKADVTDRAAMKAAADEVERVFGKIHLVSANAGVGMPASVANATYGDFDWCMAVNLIGSFNTIHEFLPRIRKHGDGGHLVATSSMSGLLPVTNGGSGVYTITKFGVVGMMEGLRAELDASRERIGVSVFCPGFVNTNIGDVDKNRTGQFAAQTTEGDRAPSAAAGGGARPPRPAGAVSPGMDPMEAGARVLRGIRNNDLYILSHSEFGPGIQERNEAIMASVPPDAAPPERIAVSGFTMRNPLYAAERDRLLARRRT